MYIENDANLEIHRFIILFALAFFLFAVSCAIHHACGQPFFERITPRLLQQLLPHLQGEVKPKPSDGWILISTLYLVGGDWNMTFIFPYIGNNHPNWLIFFKRVETTNQICLRWVEFTNYATIIHNALQKYQCTICLTCFPICRLCKIKPCVSDCACLSVHWHQQGHFIILI